MEEKRSYEKTEECHFFNICEKCNTKYYHNREYHYSYEKILCPNCYLGIQRKKKLLNLIK